MNIIYDTSESMIANTQAAGNFDNFLLQVMGTFGITTSITEKEFSEGKIEVLANKLYNEAFEAYTKKTSVLVDKTMPVFRDIYKNKGATVETIVIPFTDGKRQINVVGNLKALLDPAHGELRNSIEKFSSLVFIDQAWKEHLREMDDLKQAVHHAYLEQKDPLLIYKFEGFQMFKSFVSKMNDDTISFLFKADLPVNDADDVHEAKEVKQKKNYKEKKEEVSSALSGGGPRFEDTRQSEEKVMPVKSAKVANRNDRVSVQYSDGSIKKEVKYKTIEEDLKNNKCVIID
jgi:preprotein translocase subunit SecA